MANFLMIAASSSMGMATLDILEKNGNQVFKTARSNDKIQPDMLLDAADFDVVDEAFEKAIERFGTIDGVVCFAGSLLLKPAHLTTNQNYQDVIQSSLTTAFATTRSAGKYMKGGSVVLVSSAVHAIGLANHEAIAAAKGGIISLAKSAAATYAGQNIRFNVVSPGLTETKMTKKITGSEVALKFSTAMHALNRIGKAEDVATMVEFLLSDKANFITGQVIAVDGGLSNLQPKIKV